MIDERDSVYVPLSDKTLRKLDQLVSQTGMDEDRVMSLALTNLLACIRQGENDNDPDDETDLPGALPPLADVPTHTPEGEPAGL